MAKSKPVFFDDGSAYDMLFDFNPNGVEQFIVLPYLPDIFEVEGRARYWNFLKQAYVGWTYTILEEDVINALKAKHTVFERMRNYNGAGISSIIFSMIFRRNGIESYVSFGRQGEQWIRR